MKKKLSLVLCLLLVWANLFAFAVPASVSSTNRTPAINEDVYYFLKNAATGYYMSSNPVNGNVYCTSTIYSVGTAPSSMAMWCFAFDEENDSYQITTKAMSLQLSVNGTETAAGSYNVTAGSANNHWTVTYLGADRVSFRSKQFDGSLYANSGTGSAFGTDYSAAGNVLLRPDTSSLNQQWVLEPAEILPEGEYYFRNPLDTAPLSFYSLDVDGSLGNRKKLTVTKSGDGITFTQELNNTKRFLGTDALDNTVLMSYSYHCANTLWKAYKSISTGAYYLVPYYRADLHIIYGGANASLSQTAGEHNTFNARKTNANYLPELNRMSYTVKSVKDNRPIKQYQNNMNGLYLGNAGDVGLTIDVIYDEDYDAYVLTFTDTNPLPGHTGSLDRYIWYGYENDSSYWTTFSSTLTPECYWTITQMGSGYVFKPLLLPDCALSNDSYHDLPVHTHHDSYGADMQWILTAV